LKVGEKFLIRNIAVDFCEFKQELLKESFEILQILIIEIPFSKMLLKIGIFICTCFVSEAYSQSSEILSE
jgi:hypothetical protein